MECLHTHHLYGAAFAEDLGNSLLSCSQPLAQAHDLELEKQHGCHHQLQKKYDHERTVFQRCLNCFHMYPLIDRVENVTSSGLRR